MNCGIAKLIGLDLTSAMQVAVSIFCSALFSLFFFKYTKKVEMWSGCAV